MVGTIAETTTDLTLEETEHPEPEWRLGRGWSEEELQERLDALQTRRLSVPASQKEMTITHGWNHYGSEATVACEPLGPPVAGGAFEKAKLLITRYEFSDPRIVTGHFVPARPLLGRPMLLELKVLGLHYLCGVRVGAVRDDEHGGRSAFGFRYDTYEGHVEAGSEWFLLTKNHATGEVRFEIKAAWRPGQFPNWWSRLGFAVVARRYQRAWHRLSYLRLRDFLGVKGLPELPPGDRLVHEGTAMPEPPVQLVATMQPADMPMEREIVLSNLRKEPKGASETMSVRMSDDMRAASAEIPTAGALAEKVMASIEPKVAARFLAAAGLGAVAGMRSMMAPALLTTALASTGNVPSARLVQLMASRRTSRALSAAAALEMLADKSPWIPARIEALPLAGRALSGGVVGLACLDGRSTGARIGAALLGAGAAIGATYAMYHLRRKATQRLGIPNVLAGLIEDAVAFTTGRAMARTAVG